jgi:tetratricopeptide (TPR) repeat protein
VAHAAGWLYWLRYKFMPTDENQADLHMASELLAPVYAASPEKVPALMREAYEEYAVSIEVGQWNKQTAELYERYQRTGDLALLEAAIQLVRRSLDAALPGDRERAGDLTNLGGLLQELFERTGDVDVLIEAVDAGRKSVQLTPRTSPGRTTFLYNLAGALRTLFERTGDVGALLEAIELSRDALQLVPYGDPERAAFIPNLVRALVALFDRTGDLAALTEAIQLGREASLAFPPGHPEHASCLTDLGNALQTQFERTGDLSALTEAIELSRQALRAIQPGDPQRGALLTALGNALEMRHDRTGDLEALTEAVEVRREATQTIDLGHRSRTAALSNLGSTLVSLYERTGDLNALTQAIQVGREAMQTVASDDPGRASVLSVLGVALDEFFERTRDLGALRESVHLKEEALLAIPEDHPNRGIPLTNLGSSLHALSVRTKDRDALAKAVQLHRDAVKVTPPGHPNRAGYLSNLAIILQVLYDADGNIDALTEAIQVGRSAVQTFPSDHPARATPLANLAAALKTSFERTGELTTLTEAIQICRTALQVAPSRHPSRALYALNLADLLQQRFEATGEEDVRTEARNAFAEAAMSAAAPVRVRIRGFRGIGWAAMVTGDGVAALAAFEEAIRLLPQIAPWRLSRADREHGLGEIAGLAAEAASAAIEAGRSERGVELLEQARGVLLAQVMDIRGDLSDLRASAPSLAEEFERLRDELDAVDHAHTESRARTGTPPRAPALSPSTEDEVSVEWTTTAEVTRRITDQRQRLAQEWDRLLSEIRKVPGLQSFLKALGITELQRQATSGPVVMVNPSPYRCDVLILTSDPARPIHVIPLPGLTRSFLTESINHLRAARDTATDKDSPREDRSSAQAQIHRVLQWLWDQVAGPVLEDLGFTGRLESEAEWPRMWWCPIGEIALLPLHAAGYHRAEGDDRTVLDRVISSYTSTIRSLAYARQKAPRSFASREAALIVAMPDTPGAPSLPGTEAEANLLAGLLPQSLVLTGPQATHGTVLEALPRHRIVHLACHGLTDLGDPSASRLLLHDHASRPLTVTIVSQLRLTDADLAYLSACRTTQTSQLLADEAVHITAAFQLAGFRNVIGTVWPILDAAAVEITKGVYAILTENGTARPDTRFAAYALHMSVRGLRDGYRASPTLWAAHVHAGI